MIDQDTRAAKDFYREVRVFAERAKTWDADVLWYQTAPDEAWDLTLVSQRAYGRRDEYLAVMAAAGLDSVDQALTQKRLALPNEMRLNAIKRQVGFESIAKYRENRVPTWLE